MIDVFVNTEILKTQISEIFVKFFVRFSWLSKKTLFKSIAESSALMHLTNVGRGFTWPVKFQYATLWFCVIQINLETQHPACYAYTTMLKTLIDNFEITVCIRIKQKMLFLRSNGTETEPVMILLERHEMGLRTSSKTMGA